MTTVASVTERAPAAGNVYLRLALLWLGGSGLRLTILAPAPVISLVHADLSMSETQVGLLSGIPAAMFACAAVAGSLMIARFGALAALVIGLLVTAMGSALRGAAPDVGFLYAATVLTGLGVAIMQPSMPSLVRAWFADRIAFATAIYINGLLVGEVLAVALTLPLLLPLVGSWRMSFVFWGGVCAAIALLTFLFAPRVTALGPRSAHAQWWPNWRRGLIWKLGLMLGSVNAAYFATNFFLPRYLHETGRDGVISLALTALNLGQIPASILLLFAPGGLGQRAWPYLAGGLLCLASIVGIAFGNSLVIIGSAGVLGFAAAAVLILMLGLPAILSPPEDVHRTAAAMFTISYSCAVIVPICSGLAWDLSGVPSSAFAPIGLCVVMLIMLAASVRIRALQSDCVMR